MALIIALTLFALAVFLFIQFIVRKDRGRREPKSALFAAMGFGVLAVVGASVLNELFIAEAVKESLANLSQDNLPAQTIFIEMLKVGFIEESLKIIPLALFIYNKKYFDELTDGIIYFGITALTFGIIEDIVYSLTFGGGVGIFRIIVSPYLHVGFTILFGMQLIQHKIQKRSVAFVFFGYLAAVFIHAFYNFSASAGGLYGILGFLTITLSLNILLFIFFRRSQKIDEKYGRSTVGINKFCRTCGKPNPKQLLYCSYCGNVS